MAFMRPAAWITGVPQRQANMTAEINAVECTPVLCGKPMDQDKCDGMRLLLLTASSVQLETETSTHSRTLYLSKM